MAVLVQGKGPSGRGAFTKRVVYEEGLLQKGTGILRASFWRERSLYRSKFVSVERSPQTDAFKERVRF
jgi:hypothetical protein